MVTVTHAHVATGTDAGTGEVHKDEWNGAHVIGGALALGADFPPSSPNAANEEFDGSSLAGLTTLTGSGSTAPTTLDADTTVRGHLYMKGSTGQNGVYKAWSPADGDSVTLKVTDAVVSSTNFHRAAQLWISTASPGAMMVINLVQDGSGPRVAVNVYSAIGTFSSAPSGLGGQYSLMGGPMYLRIVRNSSTSYSYFWSTGGYVWSPILIAHNPGFTVGSVGFGNEPAGSGVVPESLFDFLRFNWTAGGVSTVGSGVVTGALDLLEQHTASSSATLDFTTSISSDYDEYLVEFLEVAPASNAVSLGMRVSTDGGATWDTTSGHYYYNNNRIVTSLANASSSTTSVQIAHNVSNSVSGLYVTGSIRVRPTGTNQRWAIGQVHYLPDSSDRCINFVNGDYENGTYNAIRFLFSSGSIASGTIRIYGFRKTNGLGTASNEDEASTLVNATSTGDAGSRADHFPGTSLGGAWTSEGAAWGQGPTVKYSSVGLRATGTSLISQTYTPSGACRVEARIMATVTGFGVKTSDAGDAGNGVLVWWGTGSFESYTLDSGSYTLRTTLANGPSTQYPNNYYYVALERDGSNNWTTYMSLDRTLWRVIDGPRSKTFTAAKIYVKLQNLGVAAVDFVDVIS